MNTLTSTVCKDSECVIGTGCKGNYDLANLIGIPSEFRTLCETNEAFFTGGYTVAGIRQRI